MPEIPEITTCRDDEIVESVRSGNTDDFSLLIGKYGQKVHHFILRMVKDPDEAKNISQEVFTNVFAALSRYVCQGNFQAFLFRAAKNTTLNYLNRQKRLVFFSSMLNQGDKFDTGELSAESADPEELFRRRRREDQVNEALSRLKENQRLALVLKVYLDLSYKEIAAITGWSTPKIETLISRAKSALKKDLMLQETRK